MAKNHKDKKRAAFLRKRIREIEQDYRMFIDISSYTYYDFWYQGEPCSAKDYIARILKHKHCPEWIKADWFSRNVNVK